MVAPGVQPDNVTIVMKGNSAMHSDAYLIFRIFADTIKTIAEPTPKKTKKPEPAALGQETTTTEESTSPSKQVDPSA